MPLTKDSMNTDLAPKYFYYLLLFSLTFALVLLSLVHLDAMDKFLEEELLTPFIVTSSLWGVTLILILLLINRCRYVIINPTDENKMVVGGLLGQSQHQVDQLTINRRVNRYLYKIVIQEKGYFIWTFDEIVEKFEGR